MDAQTMTPGLEQRRIEKLKELGYFAYNLSVSGKSLTPTQLGVVRDMKAALEGGGAAQPPAGQGRTLEDMALELGVLCFNDFVDRGYGLSQMEPLLAEISGLNRQIFSRQGGEMDRTEITDTAPFVPPGAADGIPFPQPDAGDEVPIAPPGAPEAAPIAPPDPQVPDVRQGGWTAPAEPEVPGPAAEPLFRAEVPFGMEQIPEDYKTCRCGYRNRSYANYCGKCGAKLS